MLAPPKTVVNNNYHFQQEDIIQDRFVVHADQYRAIREGLAKTVISGNIQDIGNAITVSEFL